MADKPLCGSVGQLSGDTILSRIVAVLGGLGTIGSVAGAIQSVIAATDIITIIGIAAMAGFWAAAVGGAVVGLAIIGASVVDRLFPPKGLKGCYAGVVTSITPSFSDVQSNFAPYTAQHDRVDVVVKPDYWSLVVRGPNVICDTDSEDSPLIRGYAFSSEIAGAATGSAIGGVIGAILGILAGAALAGLAAGAVAAALGCATVVLCPVAIIVGILVAFVVALVAVLVLALIGGQIGRAIAGDSSPTGTQSSDSSAAASIATADYVTINGNMVIYGEDENAIVARWIESTTIHGSSSSGEGTGGSSPFPFTDPQDNLNPDGCG